MDNKESQSLPQPTPFEPAVTLPTLPPTWEEQAAVRLVLARYSPENVARTTRQHVAEMEAKKKIEITPDDSDDPEIEKGRVVSLAQQIADKLKVMEKLRAQQASEIVDLTASETRPREL
jgi:hypothetical protein